MRHSHPSTAHPGQRLALPIDVTGGRDTAAQWVVCGGATREATGGRVACPMQGVAVTLGECLGCHCLVTHSGERDPLTDCAMPEIS